MKKLRFGIVGMGVQGSLYAAILTGQRLPQGLSHSRKTVY